MFEKTGISAIKIGWNRMDFSIVVFSFMMTIPYFSISSFSTFFHIFPHFATCFHIFLHLSTCFHIFPMFKPLMTFESHEIDRFQLLFGASRRHALHKADRLAALGGCDLAN